MTRTVKERVGFWAAVFLTLLFYPCGVIATAVYLYNDRFLQGFLMALWTTASLILWLYISVWRFGDK